MFQAWTNQTWTKWGSSLVIQSANCAISKNLSSSCRSLARIQRALEINPRKPPSATVVKASTGGAFSSGWIRVKPSDSRSRFNELCTRETPRSSAAANNSRSVRLNLGFMTCDQWRVKSEVRKRKYSRRIFAGSAIEFELFLRLLHQVLFQIWPSFCLSDFGLRPSD